MRFLQQLSCKLHYESTSLWGWQSLGQSINCSPFIEPEVSAQGKQHPAAGPILSQRNPIYLSYHFSKTVLFNWCYAYHWWYAESRQMDAKLFGIFFWCNLKDINCMIKIVWVYLNEQKNVYKVFAKILFSWSNVRTRCPLSFNRDWQRNVLTCLNTPKSLPGLRNWGTYSHWLRSLQLTLAGLCARERRPFLLHDRLLMYSIDHVHSFFFLRATK